MRIDEVLDPFFEQIPTPDSVRPVRGDDLLGGDLSLEGLGGLEGHLVQAGAVGAGSGIHRFDTGDPATEDGIGLVSRRLQGLVQVLRLELATACQRTHWPGEKADDEKHRDPWA
jgi:hypothetical protein